MLEHVGLLPFGAGRIQIVTGEVVPRERQRAGGTVQRQHRFRPACERIEREAAGVAKAVEHVAITRELADTPAVVALIEIKTGLVPFDHVHAVDEAVFVHLHAGGGQLSVEQAAPHGQPFQFAHVRVRSLIDTGAAGQFAQAVRDLGAPALRPRAEELQHDHRAIAIRDDAGQTVGFPVHQAQRVASVGGDQPFARIHCPPQTRAQESGVYDFIFVPTPDTRAYLRHGAIRGRREKFSVLGAHRDGITGFRIAFNPRHRPGEYPGMAAQEGFLAPGLQDQLLHGPA